MLSVDVAYCDKYHT